MCIVKKNNLELKRQFVSNHCVATLKDSNLVDMCLFSGEGRPTLLGGFVLSAGQAFSLGRTLMNTAGMVEKADEAEKRRIISDNVLAVYTILKDINPEQAEKLRELFDIKIIKPPQPKRDHGYIG